MRHQVIMNHLLRKIFYQDGESSRRNKKGCWGCLLLLLVVFCIAGYGLYCLEVHYQTIPSPDGKYRVEVYYYFREAIMPMMPGGGSDKVGCIYIIRNEDNRKIHRAELPMVSLSREVSFKQDSKGNTKTIYAPVWLCFELP